MAKVHYPAEIGSLSGKLYSESQNVFYTHKRGRAYLHRNLGIDPNIIPTDAQQAVREKFKAIVDLVRTDLESPELKEQWQIAADASKGKFSSAYGAAFSYHWDNYEPPVQE